ncbi:myosin-binding protein 4 [Hirschfeldia incana]|nr:myosin-binding protein 4 [Hirschfeldia incana]
MVPNVMFDQKVPVLTYAACEWFLIFLMLIDALLSYLLVWFARYCRLQMPCFLCSKILHPLHWRLLICRDHRSEVSSYMSCLNHDNKLADCRGMCNDCLLSFTKTTGPNPDVNRLLLGKLGYDLLSTNHSAHLRSCSCCSKPWRARHHTQRLIRLGSRGRNSKPNIPAPRHHHLTRRGSGGSLKKMRDHYRPATSSGGEYVDIGSRSDVGYTELKVHSGSESDFLFTDDDAFLRMTDFNVEPPERRVRKSRSRTSFEDKKTSKRKQHYDVQDNKDKKKDYKNKHERKDKKTQQQSPVAEGEHASVIFELITMSEARPFSLDSPQEDNAGEATTQNENVTEPSGNSSPSGGEFLSPRENNASQEIQIKEHDDSDVKMEESDGAMEQKVSVHLPGSVADEPSNDEEDGPEGDCKHGDLADSAQNISHSDIKMEESDADTEQKVYEHLPGSVADDEEDGAEGDFKPSASDSLAHEQSSEEEKETIGNNAAEEYFSNEEEEEINAHSDPSTSKEVPGSAEKQSIEEEGDGSNEVEEVDNEDSEPLTSNNATRSTAEEHSVKEEHGETEPLTSPKLSSQEHTDKESSKVPETQPTSKETPELKHSASVESFASISSDIEGESLVDLLKQQLEYDRKCLRELSKELEEERNASAIATNEAMAMITRLQEEKASLQMEALQYLRMMDEQAEHDVDALERANDVLADREKEIQDLEMELEYYRVKYPDESREEILASMGVLEGIETRDNSDADETSEKDPTDDKLIGSPSAEI